MFGPPPSMMDAVLATIFDGVRAIHRKQSSSRIKLIKRLFYRFILNQAKAFLGPTPSEGVARVRSGVSIVNTPYEGQTAPPWWWCLWDSCVRVDGTFHTIPNVGILRGGNFSFPPEPIGVFLLSIQLSSVKSPQLPHSLHLWIGGAYISSSAHAIDSVFDPNPPQFHPWTVG